MWMKRSTRPGLTVTKYLQDGYNQAVAAADYMVVGFDSNPAVANQALTISYTENGLTKTTPAGFAVNIVKWGGPAAPVGGTTDDVKDVFGFTAVPNAV